MTRTENDEAHKPRVVIVGAGFGGLYAARELRRADIHLTLIDRRNHHLFKPLLYQVATSALAPEEIAQPIRVILRHQKNAHVVPGTVTSIKVSERKVLSLDGELDYDYLILAAGADGSYFGNAGWKTWAPDLKDLEGAPEIRRLGGIIEVMLRGMRANSGQSGWGLGAFRRFATIVLASRERTPTSGED